MGIKQFIRQSIIGGVLVLLPSAIIAAFFYWVFRQVTALLYPVTELLLRYAGMPEIIGHLLVIILIMMTCFMTGTFVTTRLGQWMHEFFDGYLAKLPGYRIVKEIVNQLLGNSESPFTHATVGRAQLFGEGVPVTATVLVTSKHKDGSFSVFVPTGPNPTSGLIYHLPAALVTLYPEVNVDSALRTIIACGAGSGEMFHRSEASRSEL